MVGLAVVRSVLAGVTVVLALAETVVGRAVVDHVGMDEYEREVISVVDNFAGADWVVSGLE